MSMYNLLEYGDNYSIASGSLWNYFRDGTDGADHNASEGKSFKYKRKVTKETSAEENFNINFSEGKTKCCLASHCNGDNSVLFLNGKEIYKLRAGNRNVNFPTQFCLATISEKSGAVESRELSLKGNEYDFS